MKKQYGIIEYSKKVKSGAQGVSDFTGTHGKHGTGNRRDTSERFAKVSRLVIDEEGLTRTQFVKKLNKVAKSISGDSNGCITFVSSFK